MNFHLYFHTFKSSFSSATWVLLFFSNSKVRTKIKLMQKVFFTSNHFTFLAFFSYFSNENTHFCKNCTVEFDVNENSYFFIDVKCRFEKLARMKTAIKRSAIPHTWALEGNVNKLFV